MIHRVRQKLQAAFRRAFPRRLDFYRSGGALFKNKIGLEVGGPSSRFGRRGLFPVYKDARRIDNCNFGQQTIWEGRIRQGSTFQYDKRHAPGTQYVADATDLGQIPSSGYDFFISSHTLEHVANPLRAMQEWIRVLKHEGLLVLVLPHKEGTFDHRRPLTPLSHLIEDFERDMSESDLTHLEEILKLHDLARDPGAGSFEAFKQRSEKNFEYRGLHHHVFDTQLAIDMVDHMGLQILAVEVFRPYDIFLIAQKPAPEQPVCNDAFTGKAMPRCWSSPFQSDRPAMQRAA